MKQVLLLCFLIVPFHRLMAQEKEFPYDKKEAFVEDRAIVSKNGRFGFINWEYEEVIPLSYTKANPFSDGYAAVKLSNTAATAGTAGSWIFINKSGAQAIPGRFDTVYNDFKEGFAVVQQGAKRMVVDKQGKMVFDIGDKIVYSLAHGMVTVRKDNFISVVDLKVDPAVAADYYYAEILSPTLIAVGNEAGLYAIYNSRGKQLTKTRYDLVEPLNNGFVAASVHGKYGLLNKDGKEVVAPQYNRIEAFTEGLAAVLKADQWGFINEQGKEVVPVKYDQVGFFVNGKCAVSQNNKEFYIDRSGKIVDASFTSLPFASSLPTKEGAEKTFLEVLNALLQEHPYIDPTGFRRMTLDTLFTLREGVLVGTFKEYGYNGLVLHRMSIPINKLQDVWHDYNMGFFVANEAGRVQYTLPGSTVYTKEYMTDMLYLAAPGDGYQAQQWKEKLQVALSGIKKFYQ